MDIEEFEQTLADSEVILDRLRALYEQYFQGIERLEPNVPRKDLDRRIDTLRRNIPRNTALRFRFHMLLQKYTTYQTYWRRIAKQIEEGTYRRDLMRARSRREEARRDWESSRLGRGFDVDIDVEDAIEEGSEGPPSVEPSRPSTPLLDDEVMVALRALEPMPTVPPRTAMAVPSLSPFALPSRRPTAASGAPRATPLPPAAPVAIVNAGARPVTPMAPKPPDAGSAAAAQAKTFKRPLPSNRPPTGEHPQAAPVRRTGEHALDAVASPVAGPVVPRAPRVPTAEYPRSAPLPGVPAGDIDDARLRQVYDRFIAARKQNNERVDNVRFETVRGSIEKMMPTLREKHRGKQIDFEIVLKDGKVGLKPVPK